MFIALLGGARAKKLTPGHFKAADSTDLDARIPSTSFSFSLARRLLLPPVPPKAPWTYRSHHRKADEPARKHFKGESADEKYASSTQSKAAASQQCLSRPVVPQAATAFSFAPVPLLNDAPLFRSSIRTTAAAFPSKGVSSILAANRPVVSNRSIVFSGNDDGDEVIKKGKGGNQGPVANTRDESDSIGNSSRSADYASVSPNNDSSAGFPLKESSPRALTATDLRIPRNIIEATKPAALLNIQMFKRFLGYAMGVVGEDIEDRSLVRKGNNTIDDAQQRKRQINAQYGRAFPSLVRRMLLESKVGPETLFVDLGSGIGTICMQASAMTGCTSLGIELMQGRHKVAQSMLLLLEMYTEMAHVPCGAVELMQGDFTRFELRQRVLEANVIFANNAHGIFGVRSVVSSRQTLDHVVASLAIASREGTRVICFDPLIELETYPFREMFERRSFQTGRAETSWTFVSKSSESWYMYTKRSSTWTCSRCGSQNLAHDDDHNLVERCPGCADDPTAPERHYLLRGRR